MEAALITMEPAAAQVKLEAYRARLRKQHAKEIGEEWRKIADAYEALGKGRALLNLPESIAKGGWDENGLPQLAVARADAKRCRFEPISRATRFREEKGQRYSCEWEVNGAIFHSAANRGVYRRWNYWREFTFQELPPVKVTDWPNSAEAIVPSIPADVYPEHGNGSPKDWHILWEAEWTNVAPVDPILLKRLAGDLYVVLAQWDLTEVERAILMERK